MDPSPDSWSVTSSTSWWSRLKGALAGVLVGVLLFLAAFPLLIWNEGRAVRRARALGEGAANVVSVDPARVDPANEGALVHLVGTTDAGEQLVDPELGVAVTALKLRREVEMYQWVEHREDEEQAQTGGGTETVTSYEYERSWSSRLIDSERFEVAEGHRNPAAMPIPPREWSASPVSVGAYRLAPSQLDEISDWEPVPIALDSPLPDVIAGAGQVADDGYYVGEPLDPQVGDMRIRFAAVHPTEVTIVARQSGAHLEPFASGGGTIELVAEGSHAAGEMFERAVSANRIMTWVLRAVGFLLLFLGLTMIFKPLSVVADVVPFVGRVIEAGSGLIAFLVAALLAFATIAMAWVFYRPLVGVVLLSAAALVAWMARRRLQARELPGRPAA